MNKICVIGGANIDLCGSSISPLRNYDSNPGTISTSFGGVGRNIAQILALLKQNVQFVTCFSDDPYGRQMKEDCQQLGMDVSMSRVVTDLPSSMYIAILDANRDMKIGMSDMRILRRMDEAMLEPVLKNLDPDDIIIIDANLDLGCIRYILDHAPCPTAADPVSANKASRLKDCLNRITVFKPNQYESHELTGIFIKDDKTAVESLNWFLERGVKEVIISMADRGLLFAEGNRKIWLTHRRINLANATGGGDTLLGAYISERLAGKDALEALHYGISAAVTTIEQDAVRRRSLDPHEIEEKIPEMEIKERILA